MTWVDAETTLPTKDGEYLVVVSLFGKRIDEELYRRVYFYNALNNPKWRGEFDYVSSRVIAWAPLPEFPREPKKAGRL